MKIKFYLIAVPLYCLVSLSAFAQAGYNKKAMGLIGDAPKPGNFLNGASLDEVDKSTGTLKIGIPLYEIKVNDISVPITLNYTATGLKVGQEAGPAGMGWELSAGGKIITNIQGKVDGDSRSGLARTPNGLPEPFNYTAANPTDQTLLNKMLDGKEDNAWDTYTYVLPHGSGTYVKNGLTFPYDPMVKINSDGKIITTSDGLVYSFVPGDIRTTTRTIFYNGSTSYFSNPVDDDPQICYDYDLHNITSTRFKDVINFKYQHNNGSSSNDIARLHAKIRTNYSETMTLYRKIVANQLTGNSWYPSFDVLEYDAQKPILNKSTTEYNTHTRLDTIDYPTGMVVFDYNASDVLGRDELDNIRIFKKDNNILSLLKRYEFSYDPNKQFGHYLLYLTVYDGNNVRQNGWEFSYADGYLPLVPNNNNKAIDEWGFYNGKSNVSLLEDPTKALALKAFKHPAVYGPLLFVWNEQLNYYGTNSPLYPGDPDHAYTAPYANRDYDFNYALKGTLVTLRAPGGAVYKYEYEPHTFMMKDFSTGVNGGADLLKTGGGIRIRSITTLRGHDASYFNSNTAEIGSKKVFQYGDVDDFALLYNTIPEKIPNGKGTANLPQMVLSNLSVYADQRTADPTVNPAGYYKSVRNLVLVSNPINDLTICNGSNVMYKVVAETDFSDTTKNAIPLGRTVYYSRAPQFDPVDHNGWFLQVVPQNLDNGTLNPYATNQFPSDDNYMPATLKNESIFAPSLSVNMGFKPEDGAGIYEVIKAKRDASGVFRAHEITDYEYNYFRSPQTNPLKSIYAAAAGQLSGNAPVTTPFPDYYDTPPLLEGTPYSTYNNKVNGVEFTTRALLLEEGVLQDFPGRYVAKLVDLNNFSYCKKMVREAVHNIDDDSFVATTYAFGNVNHMQPTIITKSAGNDQVIDHITYPADYPPDGSGLPTPLTMNAGVYSFLQNNPMQADQPIMDYTTYYQYSSQTNKLIGGTVNAFTMQGDALLPSAVYQITPGANVSGLVAPTGMDVWHASENSNANLFKPVIHYDAYIKGQVHQYTENQDKTSVLLYGYHNQYPVAKVVNAGNYDSAWQRSTDVAYTSFETKDTCNWIYAGTPIIDTSAVSGKGVYPLSAGNITKVSATLAGKYIVSYWYKSGSVVNVSGGTVSAETVKSQLGPWILAEREVSNISGTVTVSGSGYIDELRFYPKEAQMTTYVYDPGLGITCALDANCKPLYYEYDSFQRLSQIRDHNGNIIKAYKYITSPN